MQRRKQSQHCLACLSSVEDDIFRLESAIFQAVVGLCAPQKIPDRNSQKSVHSGFHQDRSVEKSQQKMRCQKLFMRAILKDAGMKI